MRAAMLTVPIMTNSGLEPEMRGGSEILVSWMQAILNREGYSKGEWNLHVRRRITMSDCRCRIKEGAADRLISVDLKPGDNGSAYNCILRVPRDYDPREVRSRLAIWHNWNGRDPIEEPPVPVENEDQAEMEVVEPVDLVEEDDPPVVTQRALPIVEATEAMLPAEDSVVSRLSQRLAAARKLADAYAAAAVQISTCKAEVDQLEMQLLEAGERLKRLQEAHEQDTRGLAATRLLAGLEEFE